MHVWIIVSTYLYILGNALDTQILHAVWFKYSFSIVYNPVGFNPIVFISPEQWKSYLFLAPKFIEHLLNFLPPVLLHGVEAFLRGRHKGRGGYFIQPTKDFRESRPLMRLLMPAIWKSHHSEKMLSCILIVFPKIAWSNLYWCQIYIASCQ